MIIRKKHALVLVEDLTQRLNGTTITAESKYSFKFSKLQRTFWSVYYNGSNSFFYVSTTKYISTQNKELWNKTISIGFRKFFYL